MKNEFVTSKNGQKEKNQIQKSKLALFQSQFLLVSDPANRPPPTPTIVYLITLHFKIQP